MIFKDSNSLLFAIKCKLCDNEFVYSIKSGNDYRCYKCKKNGYATLEELEEEIKGMDKEEIMSFIEDIKEYEKENGKIIYKEEDDEEDNDL